MEEYKAVIGSKLRELRGERSQEEVATALNVTVNAISQYETGKRIPNDPMKVKIARFFGMSVEDLFFTKEVSEMIT